MSTARMCEMLARVSRGLRYKFAIEAAFDATDFALHCGLLIPAEA